MKHAAFAIVLLAGMAAAAEKSLVPDTPNTAPDYFCTWNVQGFACGYSNPSDQADMMTQASLFGNKPNQNWLEFFPDARGDLIFLLDDAFDFPLGGGHNHPARGSIELDNGRFPSYQGTPAERLAKLNRDVRARGWRGLGLWICNSRNRTPGQEQVDSDTYWRQRLEWSQQAGVVYWKVDWGIGERGKPLWKFSITPQGRSAAPDVWIEYASGTKSDVYRTYDVNLLVSIPETIRRIAAFLAKDDPNDRRMINCEDEVYIGAATGCHYGVMRHPLTGDMPNGKPDGYFRESFRDVKRRMDEVTRATRWHRIAQPMYRSDTITIDSNTLMDFKSKPAPARIARGGLPLPTVEMQGNQEPPYALCTRHPDGEIAIATIGRNPGEHGKPKYIIPLADITLEVGELNRPVGIFGEYASLTLVTSSDLTGHRILAQDLAGSTPVDISAEVKVIAPEVSQRRLVISPRLKDMGPGATGVGYDPGGKILSPGRLVIPGAVIHRVGLMAAKPGDVSEPGMLLVIDGLTQFIPKKPMTPNSKPEPANSNK